MTPGKILADFTRDIDKKGINVFYPKEETLNSIFQLKHIPSSIPRYEDIERHPSCRVIEHWCWRTKPYRDEGCAVYKLIRFIESALSADITELYWRYKPGVEQLNDFSEISEYCNKCGKCVNLCPVNAIYEKSVVNERGTFTRIDASKYFPYFYKTAGCSICIKVCPFHKFGYENISKEE